MNEYVTTILVHDEEPITLAVIKELELTHVPRIGYGILHLMWTDGREYVVVGDGIMIAHLRGCGGVVLVYYFLSYIKLI